ncbi:MAG: hypothetical protein V4702_01260 [Patescibacteria group bacterium]
MSFWNARKISPERNQSVEQSFGLRQLGSAGLAEVLVVSLLGFGLVAVTIEGAEQVGDMLAAQTGIPNCRGTEANIGVGPDAKPGLIPTPDASLPGYKLSLDPRVVANSLVSFDPADYPDSVIRSEAERMAHEAGVDEAGQAEMVADAAVANKAAGLALLESQEVSNILCSQDGSVYFNGLGRELSGMIERELGAHTTASP